MHSGCKKREGLSVDIRLDGASSLLARAGCPPQVDFRRTTSELALADMRKPPSRMKRQSSPTRWRRP